MNYLQKQNSAANDLCMRLRVAIDKKLKKRILELFEEADNIDLESVDDEIWERYSNLVDLATEVLDR